MGMRFSSTRNPGTEVSFREAIFAGLAPDGGLYLPTSVPDLTKLLAELDSNASTADIGEVVTSALLAPELPAEAAQRVARRAFTFDPVLVTLTDDIKVLELFHGPTCAFKDFGASFLAAIMEEFLTREASRAVILTATSGDTGSAVAHAFHKRENLEVVILYPSGRVSPLQEKQLTTLGDNITALEVMGSFDDCQRMVKAAFIDRPLNKRLGLTSANSINLGRLIPQAFYYIFAAVRLPADVRRKGPVFCVPSGNFGNLTAGVMARQWGLPIHRFIAATNINKVVPEYLDGGVYSPRASIHTVSNAMDVGDPSNFERLNAIFKGNRENMRSLIEGIFVTDEETRDTIGKVYEERKIFLDPHTALGVRAAMRYLAAKMENVPVVTLATAHPGKFLEVVEEVTGIRPPLPARLEESLRLPKSSVPLKNNPDDLKKFLLQQFG